jgi:HAD superfamily hydrolase (TIGR01458 family)
LKRLDQIKGWLIDLDGTLHIGEVPVPGAAGFIQKLRESRKFFRFVSNTTTLSRRQIAEQLRNLGMEINPTEIFTAPSAAADLLRSFSGMKCFFVVSENVMEEFDGIEVSDTNPDYVVMGDVGEKMDYALLNKAFRLVMGGAEFIALQKNKFVRDASGLRIDAGAFITAIEFAAGKQAKIIGKPSRQFFNLAVHDIRVEAGERWLSADFAIVGDDVEADIKGAMDAGLVGILVKTGKYNDSYSEHYGIVPDWTFESIKELGESIV